MWAVQLREVAGWGLVALGLAAFWQSYAYLAQATPWFLQAGPLVFIGFILFQGGLHLLKVATAARLVLQPPTDPPRSAGLKTLDRLR
jgi:uncharacterized membrane protein YgdD (TMEM256/DUF423 family)